MSYNPMMARFIVELSKAGHLGRDDGSRARSVVELGNQTMNLDEKTAREVVYVGGNGISAEEFYRVTLGFSSYTCIDTNGRHDAIQLDINEYLTREVYSDDEIAHMDRSDLVTNNGTGEHIFDQRAVFTLCHDLCKVGGVMVHILPFLNWINHCFYSYHPLFFVDMAQSNHYKLLGLSVGNRWGHAISLLDSGLEECVKQLKPQTKPSRLSQIIRSVAQDEMKKTGAQFPNILICAAMKKVHDQEFRIPFQAKYIPDISDDSIAEQYRK